MPKYLNSVTLVFQFWLSFDILVGFFSFFFCKSWDISFFLTWKIISLLPDAREVNIIRISLWPVHYGIFLSCNLRRKNILVGENSQEYPGILTRHIEFVLWVYSFLFPPKPTSALQIDFVFGVNVLHYYKTWTPIQRNCWNFTFTSLQTEISDQYYRKCMYIIGCSTPFWTGVRDRFSLPLFLMLSSLLLS